MNRSIIFIPNGGSYIEICGHRINWEYGWEEFLEYLKQCELALERCEQLEKALDNPPLKFEELKEGMWVWDNHSKKYRRVIEPFRFKGYEEWIEFEDVDELYDKNRFYRYEVQDETN